jgi:tetratricopeptide (TPR) repeat protein
MEDIGVSNKKRAKKTSAHLKKKKPQNLKLIEYEITTEPIQDRHYRRLPDHIKDKINDLYEIVQKKPDQTVISDLEALIEKYPNVPLLYNYLSVAYARLGDQERYQKTIKKNYQLNPDYLFARLNYAELFAQQGNYEKIAEIFDHKFDLKLLYPKRRKFHLSEVANFMGFIGIYFLKTGKKALAEQYYKMLAEIACDYPITQRLRKQLYPGFFRRIFRKMIGNY